MPKVAKELTAVEVRRLIRPGAHAVGGVSGLRLVIGNGAGRSWVLRTQSAGQRREIGLGGYPTVELGEARDRARKALAALHDGRDPIKERKAVKLELRRQRGRLTFQEASGKALALVLHDIAAKGRQQVNSQFERYVHPIIGRLFIDEVGRQDVLKVLAPIWADKPTTAAPLRARLEHVLTWATVNGHRTGDNPALLSSLKLDLPKLRKTGKTTHHPAVAVADAPSWFEALKAREGMAARALEFAALTAARSGEVRGATWAEIEAAMWVIPVERMKMGKEHRVPLTAEAGALLKALPRQAGSDLIFPAPRGGKLHDSALGAEMRALEATATVHGLRSTFRDWAAERGHDRDVAEIALAHQVGSDVERAYRRTDMLERRRALAAAWAGFLCGRESASNVVELRG